MSLFHHKHETHRETLYKFLGLLAILGGYFAYLSWKFDIVTGGYLAALTWSFFVLCTPIADAGFLVDFPMRLLFKIRMVHGEMGVWTMAITINIIGMTAFPDMYDKTFLTTLFKKILTTPWPYWGIILLSATGTYLSIYFGDEMIDVFKHKDRAKFHKHGFKWQVVAFIGLFVLAIVGYYELLKSLGIKIDKVL